MTHHGHLPQATTRNTLAGACVALGLAPVAAGGFVGLAVEHVFDPGTSAAVCRIYAEFSSPGDRVLAVAGTPNRELAIETGGTFYQHAFGGDTAPPEGLIPAFPSLAFDTFVTIGKLTHAGDDETQLTPGWPGFGPSALQGTDVGWYVTPDAPQAMPDKDGRVLIGQFSALDTRFYASGPLVLLLISDGETVVRYSGFCHYEFNLACTPEMDLDFDTVVGILDFLILLSEWGPCPDCESCLPDVHGGNGDCAVGIEDFLALLANWTDTPVPLPAGADADLDDNGFVDDADVLALRACWGPVAPGCEAADLDTDGAVGTRDLMIVLASWSP